MSRSNSKNPASAFDDTLEDILQLLEEDTQHFIYLTGAAGTGKTTLIERVKDECLLKKMVVAPTGVAALNIGGSTINSAFRIGFDTKNLELLIIDEISMVRAPMLDAISETLQIHRSSSKPFGGIHVLACGDLFQLPPVVKENEETAIFERYESVYFFSANNFQAIEKPSFFELISSFRQQDDKEFYDLLNNVRLGQNLEESIKIINQTCHNPEFDTESSLIITSRKYRAEQINEEMLNLIDGPAKMKMISLLPENFALKRMPKSCLLKMIQMADGSMEP